jgi:hypothetical protein
VIASAAGRIKAKSFTIDGDAVVVGPGGLSRFEELRREAAHTAILYAFDLIEHDGEDLRNRPFLERKDALARLLLGTEVGICSTNTSLRMALSFSRTLAGLAPRASSPGWTAPIDPVRARSGSRSAIRPASRCSGMIPSRPVLRSFLGMVGVAAAYTGPLAPNRLKVFWRE